MVQIVYFVILIIGFCCLIKNNKSKINSVVLSIGIFVILQVIIRILIIIFICIL